MLSPRDRRSIGARLSALALVACTEHQVVPGPAPVPAATPPAEPAPQRDCGEAGDAPTELPPRLAGGNAKLGSVVLRPDDKKYVGTSELHYDRDAWIGTMRSGHNGPVLHLLIDRREVGEHDPWGARVELYHGPQVLHRVVGPYRFDVRAGDGDPPAELEVSVEREGCPRATMVDRSTDPRWMWLSTEGIAQHTYDFGGEMLQLILDTHVGTPRFDVSMISYHQWFEPLPGAPRRFLAGKHRVTVDRVVPGPATQYTDAWRADGGEPRLHVRAMIEPSAPATFPAPVAPSTPCGDAGPARTTLPAALATAPKVVDSRTVKPGQPPVKLGPLTLDYGTLEVPAYGGGPYRVEATQVPNLQIIGDAHSSRAAVGPFHEPRVIRAGRDLLRIESVSGDTITVRRIALACPHLHRIAPSKQPIYLWLSSVGHAGAEIGETRSLLLQVHEAVEQPSLGLSAEHASLSRRLGPDLVGLAFTIDDHLVEIVDVVDGGSDPVPAAHVQLRVTPAD